MDILVSIFICYLELASSLQTALLQSFSTVPMKVHCSGASNIHVEIQLFVSASDSQFKSGLPFSVLLLFGLLHTAFDLCSSLTVSYMCVVHSGCSYPHLDPTPVTHTHTFFLQVPLLCSCLYVLSCDQWSLTRAICVTMGF